jgi:hypothetical protein
MARKSGKLGKVTSSPQLEDILEFSRVCLSAVAFLQDLLILTFSDRKKKNGLQETCVDLSFGNH